MTSHRALAPVVFLLLALAWTWPAAVSADWVGRHSDTLGTVWTIDAAWRLLLGRLHDTETAWPTGITYLRPDSFVLLPVASLFSWLGAGRLHAVLQIAGLVMSAWAAESCARRMGADRPASIVAGLGFAFGGLGSTTLLEGHVYHLLDPWLPLTLYAWWRATGPDGRTPDGLLTAAGFTGALLSTAYLGIAAAAIIAGLLLGVLIEGGRPHWKPLVAALAVALPVGTTYAALFTLGAGPWSSVEAVGGAPAGATLLNLLGPTDIIDQVYHSLVTALPATVLALFVVAPVVLRRRSGWRPVAVAGLFCLVLSMGPALGLAPTAPMLPLPLALLGTFPGIEFLHFPARIGWGWSLCAGIVAALVATEIVSRRRWAGAVLAVLLGIDLFGLMGMPGRQRIEPAAIPSAYRAAEGPVLDLFPTDVHRTRALELHFMTLACAYQSVHHRPIAEVCITTSPWSSPRARLGRWVWGRILRGHDIAEGLGEMGFATVMFHADLFRPADRARLASGLATLDASPATSSDGGEYVVAYSIPRREPVADAWRRWVEPQE